MTDPVVQAYAKRVESFSQDQIRATLANHNGLVGTDRWSRLDEQMRDRLSQMADLLRAALK